LYWRPITEHLVWFQSDKMRGDVQLVVCLLLVAILQGACAFHCDREPEGHMLPKSGADNRFKIKISGNPDKYVPGEVYTGERLRWLLQFSYFLVANVLRIREGKMMRALGKKRLHLVSIMVQMNQVHTFPPYFPPIHFNIFPSTPTSSELFLSTRFSDQNSVCISHLSQACCMP
jgi:hypothetical protein